MAGNVLRYRWLLLAIIVLQLITFIEYLLSIYSMEWDRHSNRIIDVSNSHPCPSSRIDIRASEAPPHSSDWMGRCCSPQPTGTASVLAYCSHRHAKCTLRVYSHLSPQWLAWSTCQTWWTVAREFIVVLGGNHEANVHSTLAIAENPISK